MRNLKMLLALGAMTLAVPAQAVDIGIVAGQGATSSVSSAASQSVGQSSSALIGFSTQNSAGVANSNGSGISVMSGNDQFSQSNQTSQTAQTGSTASLGLAQSSNANLTQAVGQSAAANALTGVWLFIQP